MTNQIQNLTAKPGTDIHTKLYGLDHLRAFAIAFVFLFHYPIVTHGQPEWLPGFAKFGWTGVDLFFVLSGFLISFQLFAEAKKGLPISLKTFFLKRFFRIIPAYWFTLCLYAFFPFFHEREALPPLWKFLTFTQNVGLNLQESGTFSHAWSLCVEEYFYLLLPIILIALKALDFFKKSYWLLIAFFVFGFAIRIYSFNKLYLPQSESENAWMYWYKYIYYPTYNRLDGLLVGVSVAALYQYRPSLCSKILRYGNWFIVLSLIILTAAYFLCGNAESYNASIFGFPLVAVGYGCMVIGAISPTSFLYQWNSKLTTFIAALSYGIYLTHKGIIHVTHLLLDGFTLNSNLMLLICIVTCVLFAWLLNLAIEKPFMKLRNKMLSLKHTEKPIEKEVDPVS